MFSCHWWKCLCIQIALCGSILQRCFSLRVLLKEFCAVFAPWYTWVPATQGVYLLELLMVSHRFTSETSQIFSLWVSKLCKHLLTRSKFLSIFLVCITELCPLYCWISLFWQIRESNPGFINLFLCWHFQHRTAQWKQSKQNWNI